jgi:ABC-type uncharacterized transport system substrate-binding protein
MKRREFIILASGAVAWPFAAAQQSTSMKRIAIVVELNKRAANDIDAILRGANAGNIPFYQGSKYQLSPNLKTAKMLGLTVPATLLASADNIIE